MNTGREVEQIKRDVLYRGKVFDLIVDQVRYPSGATGIREIAHHPGGAVVVPVLPDGRILLVEQMRYPLGHRLLELPAGKLSPDEDPVAAAARELAEETGWSAGRIENLTSFYTTPGFCDEVLHLFLATDLTPAPGGHRREEGEHTMTMHPLTRDDLLTRIRSGAIRDGKTILGVLFAVPRLPSHP